MAKIVKLEFIELLAAHLGITHSECERFVNFFFHLIYEKLAEDHSIQFAGFGTFSVSHRAARLGVNPRQPSLKITIPALVTPKFRSGEAFKSAIKPALNK